MDDKISIIVPIFNVEKYLDRCIKSIVKQTFSNLEIILIDDGSPDRCPQICESWKKLDKRIIVIHKENGGLSSARNAGLKVATGDFVAFIDSDDWIETDMIETLHELLIKFPDIDISNCGVIDNVKTEFSKKLKKEIQPIKIYDNREMWELFYRIHGEGFTSICSKLYRKKILKDFYFVETLNEDVEARYEFCLRARGVVSTDKTGYHYWYNSHSISNSCFSEKDLDYFLVWNRIIEKTSIDKPEYLYYANMGRMRADFTMLAKMYIRGIDKTNLEIVKLKKELKSKIRNNYLKLIKWKMPFSRKILLTILCILPF